MAVDRAGLGRAAGIPTLGGAAPAALYDQS